MDIFILMLRVVLGVHGRTSKTSSRITSQLSSDLSLRPLRDPGQIDQLSHY